MRSETRTFGPACLALTAAVTCAGGALAADAPPPGVEQLLPRGRIAAILEPRFVPADEAEIVADAWVLGVVVDGEARAYSLNLLNSHEVVNDRIGERSFAAVWWPLANTAVVYDRRFGDRVLHFEASGALLDASLVMRDRETDSWWSIMTSTAIGGAMEGAELVGLPVGERATWRDWVARHPDTLVLSVDGSEHVDKNPYDRYFASDDTFRDLKVDDRRLPPKEPVFSFWWNGRAIAIAHRTFEGGRLFRLDGLGERRLLLHREAGSPLFASSKAFLVGEPLIAESGDDLRALLQAAAEGRAGIEPLTGIDTFWYTWVAVHEKTELLE